jgi:hypothetical protein
MHYLPCTASRQIVDQSGISRSPNQLTDDERAVQFGCTEEVEDVNISVTIGHARTISTPDDRAYPSCYVVIEAAGLFSASISRRRDRIADR